MRRLIGGQCALPESCLCSGKGRFPYAQPGRSSILCSWNSVRSSCSLPFDYSRLTRLCGQGHRFDITQEYGWMPCINVAAIYIVHLPSIVLSFACLTYAGTSSPRSSLPLLTCSQDSRSATPRAFGVSLSLTVSRFMWLILMSVLHMVWALNHRIYPSLYRLIHSVETADLHSDFLRVDQFYLCIFPENVQHSYYFLWWTVHSSTFIFFASSC